MSFASLTHGPPRPKQAFAFAFASPLPLTLPIGLCPPHRAVGAPRMAGGAPGKAGKAKAKAAKVKAGQKNTRRRPRSRSSRFTVPGTTTLSEVWAQRNQQADRHPNNLHPESCPALVLNADFSPLSYLPLSLWPWQEVIKAVFLNRVTVVATYDVGIRSPSVVFPLPSVVSLKQFQPLASKKPAFSRFNVFLRDGFSCQYCGCSGDTQDLTFDHVVPRCCGGKTNWTNVVAACVQCNHSKGRRLLRDLPGMRLRRTPIVPNNIMLQSNARKFPPRYLHESWRDYVYWSSSMQVEGEDDHPKRDHHHL